MDVITEKIWGKEKIGTESLSLATLDINQKYAHLPVRMVQ